MESQSQLQLSEPVTSILLGEKTHDYWRLNNRSSHIIGAITSERKNIITWVTLFPFLWVLSLSLPPCFCLSVWVQVFEHHCAECPEGLGPEELQVTSTSYDTLLGYTWPGSRVFTQLQAFLCFTNAFCFPMWFLTESYPWIQRLCKAWFRGNLQNHGTSWIRYMHSIVLWKFLSAITKAVSSQSVSDSSSLRPAWTHISMPKYSQHTTT